MPIASNRCTDGLGTRFLEIECNPWFGGSYINCKTSAFGTELCGSAQNLRNINRIINEVCGINRVVYDISS
ncbi:MAG: hypothetical protein IJC66_01270, partial [Kiritimatiellae bacterium]|nr:hypothetical protein [Kiritimatiellia bacterium]